MVVTLFYIKYLPSGYCNNEYLSYESENSCSLTMHW